MKVSPMSSDVGVGDNDPGSMWNSSQTRRSFLKRTGTVGAATILTWQGLPTKSWAETTGGGAGGSSGRTFRMKLGSVVPNTAEAIDQAAPFTVEVGGVDKAVSLWIEIMTAEPFGTGFTSEMTSVEFGYSLVASVGIDGIQKASVIIEIDAWASVDTSTGELSSGAMAQFVDVDGGPGVLPPLTDVEFQFEPGGPTYKLSIEYSAGGSAGTTYASAKALLDGTGVDAETATKQVTHVFESFEKK